MNDHDVEPAVAEQIDEIEAKDKSEHRKARGAWFGLIAGVGFTALMFAILFGMMQSRTTAIADDGNTKLGRQQTTINDLAEGQRELRDLLREANRLLAAEGQAPLPVPAPVETEPPPPPLQPGAAEPQQQQPPVKGKQGDPGPPPSAEQIAIAVEAFCRDNPAECKGNDGKPGTNAKDVTPEQVIAAIATYCDPRGQCKGDTGPGPDDAQILAGVAAYCANGACKGDRGDAGPGPTEEQIAAAVAAYCGDDRCRGDDGNDGENGRSITNARCVDGRLIIYYSDDTTSDAGGDACRPAPTATITEPGPTTTVTVTPTPTEPTQEES